MHRRIGIVLAVALLVAGLAAPASAKKPGLPGPPSGKDLDVTVEPSSGLMWANSVGDQILFDITVTNTSGGDLTEVTVTFESDPLLTIEKPEKNKSGITQHTYTVLDLDLSNLEFMEQTDVSVGTVEAKIEGTVIDSDDAIMTAYRVEPCDQNGGGSFVFTTDLQYEVCSFSGTGSWTLTTRPANPIRGKRIPTSATVRDGVPGNWCNVETYVDGNAVIDILNLPSDGVCLGGGAGGETIPVRNTNLFYLATWKGNVVTATPGLPQD